MSIGLDLGTTSFRSLRIDGSELRGRRINACYTVVLNSTVQRDLLARNAATYVPAGEELVVLGRSAEEVSEMLQAPLQPLLPGGRLPSGQTLSRQAVAAVVDAVLPPPNHPGEVCCLTIPPGGLSAHADPLSDPEAELEYFCHVVQLKGYKPVVLGQSLAITLAEAVDENFTGMTAVFGASSCEFAVAHQGREIARIVVPKGGHWIDHELALGREEYFWDRHGHRLLDTPKMTRLRERSRVNVAPGADEGDHPTPFTQSIARLTRQLLAEVCLEAGRQLAKVPGLAGVPQPLTMTYSGGLSRTRGFGELLRSTVYQSDWPIAIKRFDAAEATPFLAARGCLIHAELEEQHLAAA